MDQHAQVPHNHAASPSESSAHMQPSSTESVASAPKMNTGASKATVPLNQLRPEPQWIVCPDCQQTVRTNVEGRSEGKQTFMNVFWWPLPGRKHWWEKTHWFCSNCNKEVAMQKSGKDIQLLQ